MSIVSKLIEILKAIDGKPELANRYGVSYDDMTYPIYDAIEKIYDFLLEQGEIE